jgi:hypothetical protein
MKSNFCHCGAERRKSGRYCKKCHADYLRSWRKKNPKSKEQRFKSNARSYLHVYVKRGKIKKLPCEKCGSLHSEAHHPDYSEPLKVKWLCRAHHLDLHKEENRPCKKQS